MDDMRPEKRLREDEFACLARLAGIMIPASDALGMPAADDPAVLAEMVTSIGNDLSELKLALDFVMEAVGASMPDRKDHDFLRLIAELRNERPAAFGVIEAVVARAYYRDPRVLTALGVSPQPPFPAGFSIEQTDWSLLDPVKARGPIWRKTG